MIFLRQIFTLVEKDVVSELRTKEMLNSIFVFILLTMVIFNFAFGEVTQQSSKQSLSLASGLLWVAFSFAAVLGLNRTFVHEKDEGCMDGLLLCPADRLVIYYGKVLGNILFISVIELMALPIFSLFFIHTNYLSRLWLLLITIFLSNIGIASIGTLLSAISINTKARDLMLPILFFPIIVPVLIAAVKLTGMVFFSNMDKEVLRTWIPFLGFYDFVFIMVSFFVFEYVVEE